MTTITRALRAAADMIEIERAAFVGCQAWPDGSLRGSDVEICQQYDKVLGMLRDALDAVQHEQVQDEHDAVRACVPPAPAASARSDYAQGRDDFRNEMLDALDKLKGKR